MTIQRGSRKAGVTASFLPARVAISRYSSFIMRAPRWFRDFCAWRWAPSVALITGALLFIVMVLLLIPQQLGTASQAAETARTPSTLGDPPARAVADTPADDTFARPGSEGSTERAFARTPSPAPTMVPAAGDPTAVTPPNYQANITARADRPTRPTP
jgi:hypothetical protein